MPEDDKKPDLPIESEPPKQPPTVEGRKVRRRTFKFDKELIANWIFDTHKGDVEDRSSRTAKRMERRAKLMGWLPQKDFPWPNSANFWVATMMIAKLKTEGTLQNALKSLRPMMQAKALQRRNNGKSQVIDQLLDFQFFTENDGEEIIDAAVSNFVSDEALFIFSQWVKETQTLHDVRIHPGLSPDQSPVAQLLLYIKAMFSALISVDTTHT